MISDNLPAEQIGNIVNTRRGEQVGTAECRHENTSIHIAVASWLPVGSYLLSPVFFSQDVEQEAQQIVVGQQLVVAMREMQPVVIDLAH